MKPNHGAQYEISIDGVPRTYRDRQDLVPQRSYLFAMSSMPPAYLRAELVTPSKSEATEMPTLRGLDEEFGQAAGVTQLDRTRSILLAVALGAAILGGLTLTWLAVDGSVRPKVALSAPISPAN